MITSTQNQRVKDAVKLRQRRQRERQGRLLIDGSRELARAIQAGIELREVFVCAALCETPQSQLVVEMLQEGNAEIVLVTEAVFAKLAFGHRTEGVVAVADMPQRTLDQIQLPANPLVLVLDRIEKPGNVGAILRSADAAGVSAVVLTDGATDLYNPNCVRASLGAVFTGAVCESTAPDTLAWARKHQLQLLAARVDASVVYTEVDFTVPTVVVLGSETSGLGESWRADGIRSVGLPMHGAADSLNVSATAAVIAFEALRQREIAAPTSAKADR